MIYVVDSCRIVLVAAAGRCFLSGMNSLWEAGPGFSEKKELVWNWEFFGNTGLVFPFGLWIVVGTDAPHGVPQSHPHFAANGGARCPTNRHKRGRFAVLWIFLESA